MVSIAYEISYGRPLRTALRPPATLGVATPSTTAKRVWHSLTEARAKTEWVVLPSPFLAHFDLLGDTRWMCYP